MIASAGCKFHLSKDYNKKKMGVKRNHRQVDWARSISLRVLHAPATSTGTPVAHFVTHFFSFRKGTGFRAGRISFRQEEKIKLPAGRRGIGPKWRHVPRCCMLAAGRMSSSADGLCCHFFLLWSSWLDRTIKVVSCSVRSASLSESLATELGDQSSQSVHSWTPDQSVNWTI